MAEDKRVLNLDELFGAVSTIAVMWAGAKHWLRRPEEMGPRDLVQYDRLNKMLSELGETQSVENAESQAAFDEQRAKMWERTIDEMLRLIGPTLLAIDPPLPFTAKTRVLSFYTEELTAGQTAGSDPAADEKKVSPTGETSLPG